MYKLILSLLCIVVINSCKSKKDEPKMIWTYKSNTHTCETPTTEILDASYYQIHGEISVSNALHLYPTSFAIGTTLVDSINPTALLVNQKGIDTFIFIIPKEGYISITQNKEDMISGNFIFSTQDGDSINGIFEHVPVN